MCARDKVGPESRRAEGKAATAAGARSLGDRAQVVEHRTRVRHLARGCEGDGGGEGRGGGRGGAGGGERGRARQVVARTSNGSGPESSTRPGSTKSFSTFMSSKTAE